MQGHWRVAPESFQKVPFCLVSLIQQDLGADTSSRSLAGGALGIIIAISFFSTRIKVETVQHLHMENTEQIVELNFTRRASFWTLVFSLTFLRQPILWLWRWFIFMMWQFVTSNCIRGKWLKRIIFFFLANQTGLLLKHCSNKDILMLNYFAFAEYLYFFVPTCRMLEDDLKLSSDEEENEQVRLSFMLRCLNVTPWHWPGRLSWILTNLYKCQVVVF